MQKDRGSWRPEPRPRIEGEQEMISLTTNTRGKTFMNDSTEGEKTETPLAEIVSGYNKLAEQLGLKPVKRFKDRESAIRRFTELKAKADAPKEELSAEDAALLAKINDAVKQMNDAEQKLNDAEQKLNADKPKEKKLSATKKATAPKKAKKVAMHIRKSALLILESSQSAHNPWINCFLRVCV